MRYRKLDKNFDFVLGHGTGDFFVNLPEAVGQAVLTRLRLWRGEWFLDIEEGTPYVPAVLGKHTMLSYDFAIRQRILDTEGVTSIDEYESLLDDDTRQLTISATISTIYGPTTVQGVL